MTDYNHLTVLEFCKTKLSSGHKLIITKGRGKEKTHIGIFYSFSEIPKEILMLHPDNVEFLKKGYVTLNIRRLKGFTSYYN